MSQEPPENQNQKRDRATEGGICGRRHQHSPNQQQRVRHPETPKMPVFLVDGLSRGKEHPDIAEHVERHSRGILPSCHVEDEGGFLYLRTTTGRSDGQTPAGHIVWLKNRSHAAALAMLDRFESPWRKRRMTVALQDGDDRSIPCWAYFPEMTPPAE